MLFNSFHFLVFFPVVATIFFFLPYFRRWIWIFLASCYFYIAFIPAYILVLFALILIDYAAGILIEKASDKKRRKRWLVFSLVANLCLLGFFKYYDFFLLSSAGVVNFLGFEGLDPQVLKLVLPIGLSFHTFQSMAYTIEVYRGKQKAERHLGIYAVYVLFFPQMVAGPIERPQNLLHQFRQKQDLDEDLAAGGLRLMLVGFFKKIVIADRLALVVNQVYGAPTEYSGPALALATYFFAFQIYCDFSGYSDIAIGAARVMGFRLMNNFERPYFSQSVAEFWRRWHISLSTWFRDYVYIPLGGNRVSGWRWQRNILIVFILSGLWHGANWTFVLWGAIHGVYILASETLRPLRSTVKERLRIPLGSGWLRAARVLLTFHLVLVAWIFFRAKSVSDALYILAHFFDWGTGWSGGYLGLTSFEMFLAFFFIGVLLVGDFLKGAGGFERFIRPRPVWVRWPMYYVLILTILFFGRFDARDFIYFQF